MNNDHNPLPGERKSGIPEGVDIPAPLNTTPNFDDRIKSAALPIPFVKLVI